MADSEAFRHSTPERYDRSMVPLLFAPHAELVAALAARFAPARILETAAGTGVLTRAVHAALPDAEIVATDLNPAMLDVARRNVQSARVSFAQANAQALPFPDDAFDLVLSQFGVMFFPDKVLAAREARRVLTESGRYVLVTFASLRENPIPQAADAAVAALFPDDPPRYMERGPFSYSDPGVIEQDLREAGFSNIDLETHVLLSRVDARDAAEGMVLGSPFRAEIERRDPTALERAADAVARELQQWDGQDAPISAHLVTASA